MKKILVLAAFVLSTTALFAQQEVGAFVVRPMVGVTFSSFGTSQSAMGSELKSKYKAGFTAGAELGYQINSWLQPSVGLFYSQQGSKIKAEVGTLSDSEKMKMDYLAVPILANFYVAKGLALKAGVQPSFLLSAKEESHDIKDHAKSFQLQIPVGVSYEYANFVLDLRAAIPVTKTFKKESTGNIYVLEDARNNLFQVTVGYNFAF